MICEQQILSGNVELDGNRFIKCKFQNATLIYRGGEPPQIIDCSFDPAQIEFQDAAANTVRLMGAMSRQKSGLRYFVARMLWDMLDKVDAERGVDKGEVDNI